MTTKSNRRVKRNIAVLLAALVCMALFVAALSNSNNMPDWNALFKKDNSVSQTGDDVDYIRILDVGQGDSILIRSNGQTAVIDTGTPESAEQLISSLNGAGVQRIDVLMLSHLHMDHTGGLNRIIEEYKVVNMVLPSLTGEEEGLPAAKVAAEKVTAAAGGVFTAKQGMYMNIGDFTLTVLCYYDDFSKENDRSIIVMAEIQGKKFLLMADGERPLENRLLNSGINLKCDVIKAGHHGSNSSSSEKFVKAVSPKYAAISVGANNSYKHPDGDILSLFSDNNMEIFRTDRDGDITFFVEDGEIRVELQNFK